MKGTGWIRHVLTNAATFWLLLTLVGCGGSEAEGPPAGSGVSEATLRARAEEAELLKVGEKVYTAHCLNCHMANGQGSPKLNPSLVTSSIVTGPKPTLIKVILLGNQAEELRGGSVDADNEMAAYYLLLDDKQVAGVATFIRQRYGRMRDRVRPEEAAEVRKDLGLP